MYATGSSARSASMSFSPTSERLHFALAASKKLALEIGGDAFHSASEIGRFSQALRKPVKDFFAAILLAPAVFLDDEEARNFHPLVGGKAVFAARIQTLAPAANDGLVVARVDDARLTLATSRASQR